MDRVENAVTGTTVVLVILIAFGPAGALGIKGLIRELFEEEEKGDCANAAEMPT
jgi:hypothetical protein